MMQILTYKNANQKQPLAVEKGTTKWSRINSINVGNLEEFTYIPRMWTLNQPKHCRVDTCL